MAEPTSHDDGRSSGVANRLAGAGNRVVVGGVEMTWSALPPLDIESSAPTVVRASSGLPALAAVRRHMLDGTELLIASASRVDDALRADLRDVGFAVVTATGDASGCGTVVETLAPHSAREPEPGRLWLLTSGSTGRPKRVGHTLASLTTMRGRQVARTWLCPYSPGTYAWWQLVTLSLTQPNQHLVVVEPAELDGWPALAAKHGVTAASGTPTFWRQAIHRDPAALAAVPLEQVTLGGEPVDQAILDRLRDIFPTARISWIYASTEVGASIVVHDGRAGFPVTWLDKASGTAVPREPTTSAITAGASAVPDRPTIAIDGEELVISSPHAGAGLAGAVRTGDRVEIRDGRVIITGRIGSDEINIGGAKISAGAVRAVLLAHPDVAWARVTSRRSPLVGRVVVAEVVLTAGAQADETALIHWCAERLPEYGVPRLIRFRDEIPTKETLKSDA